MSTSGVPDVGWEKRKFDLYGRGTGWGKTWATLDYLDNLRPTVNKFTHSFSITVGTGSLDLILQRSRGHETPTRYPLYPSLPVQGNRTLEKRITSSHIGLLPGHPTRLSRSRVWLWLKRHTLVSALIILHNSNFSWTRFQEKDVVVVCVEGNPPPNVRRC